MGWQVRNPGGKADYERQKDIAQHFCDYIKQFQIKVDKGNRVNTVVECGNVEEYVKKYEVSTKKSNKFPGVLYLENLENHPNCPKCDSSETEYISVDCLCHTVNQGRTCWSAPHCKSCGFTGEGVQEGEDGINGGNNI